MKDLEIWQDIQRKALASRAAGLSELHKKNYGYNFILGAIEKVPQRQQTDVQMEVFKLKTETLINILPGTEERSKVIGKTYQLALSEYKVFLMKEYNMISKGYYTGIWMSLGIAIGMSFGVALKNIALGIPIGIGIGVAIGGGLNAKAQKEGRVL